MKKQPERKLATKQNFVKAFLLLYSQKTVDKITIAELSLQAGYNRATFYRYFEDIYDLQKYVEEYTFMSIKDEILKFYKADSFEEEFADRFVALYEKWSPYLNILLDDMGSARFSDLKQEVIEAFCKANDLPVDDIELEYMIDLYITYVLTAVNKWRKHKDTLSYERFSVLIKKLLMNGILPQIRNYTE